VGGLPSTEGHSCLVCFLTVLTNSSQQ